MNEYEYHVNQATKWLSGPHANDKAGQVAITHALLAVADRMDRLCEIESRKG